MHVAAELAALLGGDDLGSANGGADGGKGVEMLTAIGVLQAALPRLEVKLLGRVADDKPTPSGTSWAVPVDDGMGDIAALAWGTARGALAATRKQAR